MSHDTVDFLRALEFVLAREGGYVNDPDDRGGATNQGVTQATYDAHLRYKGEELRPVLEMTDEERNDIYRDGYWFKARCHLLRWPLSLVVFDAAVNSGPKQSIRWLQGAVGATVDGVFGPMTCMAVDAVEPLLAARKHIEYREAFLRELAKRPKQDKFLKGWLRRTQALLTFAEKSYTNVP